MSKFRFAAFVMTYERPEVLRHTIAMLQQQRLPPEKILIVDNSESRETENLILELASPDLEYFRVGYNSGPAGAARIGLQRLSDAQFDWIYWGDDDNPPRDQFEFEELFQKLSQLLLKEPSIGVFSGKGGRLNTFTGRIRSLSNRQLMEDSFVEVDSVPGGHTLLVRSEVVKKGALPNAELFFGFEELDFSLKVRELGYKLLVDAEKWLQIREKAHNSQPKFRPRTSGFGKPAQLPREYYSTRNLLFIFFRHRYYVAFLFNLLKTVLKSFLGFRFGFQYGLKNFKIQWRALSHFFSGKGGRA